MADAAGRSPGSIRERVRSILGALPPGVELVAAAKRRNASEIREAIAAGVTTIGENYLQEAEVVRPGVGAPARWHFIGRLQRNKVARIVAFFDLIETVDSLEAAREIDRRARAAGRVMPVFVEVNIAGEASKAGVRPDDILPLLKSSARFGNLVLAGLMTIGPAVGNPGDLRPFFREMRARAAAINALGLPGVNLRHLSMGMSDSWPVAVEEGATIVRVGNAIFGSRQVA